VWLGVRRSCCCGWWESDATGGCWIVFDSTRYCRFGCRLLCPRILWPHRSCQLPRAACSKVRSILIAGLYPASWSVSGHWLWISPRPFPLHSHPSATCLSRIPSELDVGHFFETQSIFLALIPSQSLKLLPVPSRRVINTRPSTKKQDIYLHVVS